MIVCSSWPDNSFPTVSLFSECLSIYLQISIKSLFFSWFFSFVFVIFVHFWNYWIIFGMNVQLGIFWSKHYFISCGLLVNSFALLFSIFQNFSELFLLFGTQFLNLIVYWRYIIIILGWQFNLSTLFFYNFFEFLENCIFISFVSFLFFILKMVLEIQLFNENTQSLNPSWSIM